MNQTTDQRAQAQPLTSRERRTLGRLGERLARLTARLVAADRLRRGYCPECNSSPPLLECAVCRGCTEYGPTVINEATRAVWASRLQAKVDAAQREAGPS